MARGGRIGPPHITRSRSAFNALDMFKKLIQAVAPTMIYEDSDIMIYEDSDIMVYD